MARPIGMGRRSRRRAQEELKDHVARVRVGEAAWLDFRRSIGPRSVARALGELVDAEVARQRQLRVRRDAASDRDLLDALDDARELRDRLEEIVQRLEARRS